MKNFLLHPPVLAYLVAFNLSIAIAAHYEFEGAKKLIICIPTGMLALAALVVLLSTYRGRRGRLAEPDAVHAVSHQ